MTIDLYLKTQDRIDAIRGALEAHKSDWCQYLQLFSAPFNSLLVIRDWQGRIHVGVPGNKKFDKLPANDRPAMRMAIDALKTAAGVLLFDPNGFVYQDELFDAEALWASADKVLWEELGPLPAYWIERQAKEKIWTQSPPPVDGTHPLRIVYFGIKGGVGRSSALLASAYHLLGQGKKVLVIDADFESPGVSATLLADDLRPDYGLLDWFALDALRPDLAEDLISTKRLCERSGLDAMASGEGTVWVAPSFGRATQDYVGKLGRLYQDVAEQGYVQRFKRLLESLEAQLTPDVVLIDSRAGIDDTAAVALTQLDAHGLLFATHGRATWTAYEHLFKHWQLFAQLKDGGEDFRSRLHMVSALTPVDTTYDQAFLGASYRLFLDHLYEELGPEQMEGEGFNYGEDAPEAPHRPWRVRWDDVLRHFDPIQNPAQLDAAVFEKAFGDLKQLLDQLLGAEGLDIMNSQEATQLRAELLNVAQNWRSEDKPMQPTDIFFPPAHVRALALDRPLVIGMRGAGKSFWSEALTNESLRPALSKVVRGFDKLRFVGSIRWDVDALSTRLPNRTHLEKLKDSLEPRVLWLALVLNELRPLCEARGVTVGMPHPTSDGGWTEALLWAGRNQDALTRSLELINSALSQSGEVALVVFDALDRMQEQLAHSVDYLRGLLQLLLDARQLKGLRFKVFLREDMTNMPNVLSFPDASKLVNEAVHLKWTREDIYALHWHKLAQGSRGFQKLLSDTFGPAQLQFSDGGYWHEVLVQSPPDAGKLTDLLKLLAPPYMGSSPTKGHVYTWWYKHLADGKDRVSPRTFAASLTEALQASQRPNSVSVLMPAGIQSGVRAASDARVEELREDYFWVGTALAAFNDRSTPISVKEIYGVWSVGLDGTPTPRLISEQCSAQNVFVPWDEGDRLTSNSQKLRDTLVELGILILRDDDTRLDMPDIYRLGYRIRKRGGVSPRR